MGMGSCITENIGIFVTIIGIVVGIIIAVKKRTGERELMFKMK